jgi:predicted nucleotidyltransferase
MFGPPDLPEDLARPVVAVVCAVLGVVDTLRPGQLMVVGAQCRDIWHRSLGHLFPTTATHDLDLALGLSSWDAFTRVAKAFPAGGDTGIRFRIADVTVDLIPFGEIERPPGEVTPPTRADRVSVWAFEEIFRRSVHLALPGIEGVRIATVPGYAAAKLGAWLDRSEFFETKDAADLALTLHWYAEHPTVRDWLYDTDAGVDLLVSEAMDVALSGARLLGRDVVAVLGPDRRHELLDRWPGDANALVRALVVRGNGRPPEDLRRRAALLAAFTRGLVDVTRAVE